MDIEDVDNFGDTNMNHFPLDAFSSIQPPFELDDEWLQAAEEEDQQIALRAWFLARYCDPALETPYNGREGGYLFIHGGPYDPADVLYERFSTIVTGDVLREIIDEMHGGAGGDSWAPIYEASENYDDNYDVVVEDRDEPIRKLLERLKQSELVLNLQGDETAQVLVQKLAYGSIITTLESFLWETIVYWVDHDEQTVVNIVTMVPAFRERSLKLGEIFKRSNGLIEEIKAHLQNLVWHNWEHVAPLFKFGLSINVPSFKQFNTALMKRHDIVHRSGFTKAGEPVVVELAEINALSEQIRAFAKEINSELNKQYQSDL